MNSDDFLSKLIHLPMLDTCPQVDMLPILTAFTTLFWKLDVKYQVQIQRLE